MNRWLPWLVLVAAPPAQAATVFEYREEGRCPATVDKLVASGPFLRMDSRIEGMAQTTLFDGTESLATALMHDRREYHQMELDPDALDYQTDVMASTGHFMDKQMEKIAQMQKQQCEQMRKQRIACPQMPDMKAMMAQVTAMSGMAAIEIVDTGRDDQVAGLACRWWQRRRGGVAERELCHADVSQAAALAEADRRGLARGLKAMMKLGATMAPLMQRFGGMPSGGPPPERSLLLAETCLAADGEAQGRVRAELRTEDVSDSQFEVPAGYSRAQMQ